ncbi:unnamed protein product [Cylicostephanus goldi]|uniref:EF-hand domain-containing protein n=1 Tax=Cylicostephanus goldi TaxID=71465 RepID=A0A3P6SUD8_CYLGO|nr:unnamed protein product [Cylicostephanus goldi]
MAHITATKKALKKEQRKKKSGKICKEEFVRYMRCPPVHRTTLKELETQFHNFDSDGDGSITEGHKWRRNETTAFLVKKNLAAKLAFDEHFYNVSTRTEHTYDHLKDVLNPVHVTVCENNRKV